MDKLDKLEKKLKKRENLKEQAYKSRKKQQRKFDKTGKKSHKSLAAQKGREMRNHEKAIKKLKRKIAAEEKRLAELKKKIPSGTGAWGGTKSIIQNEVMPLARERGIAQTSAKRWETFGNPSSDHWMGNRTAFAKDFATNSNYDFARAIFSKLTGRPGSEWAGDYSNFYIVRDGKTFRVQIIAGTHGTGPHLHIGIRKA